MTERLCAQGLHEMTPANSYVRTNGPRKSYAPQCRACRQIAWKRSSDARKQMIAEGRTYEEACPDCGQDDFMGEPGLHRHRAMVHGWLPPHGTRPRYVEHGCHCKECVAAQSLYNRDNKRKHAAVRRKLAGVSKASGEAE